MNYYDLPGAKWPNVDVVGEYFREAQILAVLGRKPKKEESLSVDAVALLVPEPDNPHDANAISVRIDGHVVGYLDRQEAKMWRPVFHRISASGAIARTPANIYAYMRPEWENGRMTKPKLHANVRVALPETGKALPLNARALDGVSILPWGNALQVTGEEDHLSHLFEYVPPSGEGMVVLTMHTAERTLKNGTVKTTAEVRLDGDRVGQMTPASSQHFLPSIRHAEDMGKQLGVWARLKGSGLAVELVVQGARASELADDWLRTMPELPALVAEAPFYDVPAAYTEATKSAKPRPKSAPEPTPVIEPATEVAAAEIPHDQSTEIRVGKKSVTLTDKQRQHSPTTFRVAGIAFIVLGVVVGAVLSNIPGVGPILFVACVGFGIYGNIQQRRIAKALEIGQGRIGPIS